MCRDRVLYPGKPCQRAVANKMMLIIASGIAGRAGLQRTAAVTGMLPIKNEGFQARWLHCLEAKPISSHASREIPATPIR
jgi:hypothetical protein